MYNLKIVPDQSNFVGHLGFFFVRDSKTGAFSVCQTGALSLFLKCILQARDLSLRANILWAMSLLTRVVDTVLPENTELPEDQESNERGKRNARKHGEQGQTHLHSVRQSDRLQAMEEEEIDYRPPYLHVRFFGRLL